MLKIQSMFDHTTGQQGINRKINQNWKLSPTACHDRNKRTLSGVIANEQYHHIFDLTLCRGIIDLCSNCQTNQRQFINLQTTICRMLLKLLVFQFWSYNTNYRLLGLLLQFSVEYMKKEVFLLANKQKYPHPNENRNVLLAICNLFNSMREIH
jgi:hypothetical protein